MLVTYTEKMPAEPSQGTCFTPDMSWTKHLPPSKVLNCVSVADETFMQADRKLSLVERTGLDREKIRVAAFLETPAAVKKLFDKLGTRFGQRNGGYTRVVRLGWRKGDGAELAKIELMGTELVKRAAERAKRREERLKAVQEGREHEGDGEQEES